MRKLLEATLLAEKMWKEVDRETIEKKIGFSLSDWLDEQGVIVLWEAGPWLDDKNQIHYEWDRRDTKKSALNKVAQLTGGTFAGGVPGAEEFDIAIPLSSIAGLIEKYPKFKL